MGGVLEALGGGLGEPVDQGDEAQRGGDRAGDVVAGVAAGARLGDQGAGEQGGHDGDRSVHRQAPAPREVLGQDAAEQQAQGGAATGDRAHDAEGLGALLRVVEADADQGQGGGREEGGEPALEGAGSDEQPQVGGQAADERGQGEAAEADEEGPLATPVVRDAPAEQQEAAEGQGVGGDDPLHVRGGDLQVGRGAGDREVHDRRVEDDHQLGDGDDRQRLEPPGVGRREVMGVGGRCPWRGSGGGSDRWIDRGHRDSWGLGTRVRGYRTEIVARSINSPRVVGVPEPGIRIGREIRHAALALRGVSPGPARAGSRRPRRHPRGS